MFERVAGAGRVTVELAQEIARGLGSEDVKPEHLLLAVARGHEDGAVRALAEAGLDYASIAAALEADLVATLAVVGVPASVVASAPPRPSPDRPPFGVLAVAALRRGLREAARRGDRRIGPEHLLLGALRPPDATVGRVLGRLEIEPERLAALVEHELAAARR